MGLGNPGSKFKETRHNLGFEVVNKFAEKYNFQGFKFVKKYNALISRKDQVLLVKPQTFMNNSGQTAETLMKYTECTPSNLWVIQDDLDLVLGKLKIVENKGAGGHKGVQSITDKLNTKNFTRFRIGIAPVKEDFKIEKKGEEERIVLGKKKSHVTPQPSKKEEQKVNFPIRKILGEKEVVDNKKIFVLEEFTEKERKVIEKAKSQVADAINFALENDIEEAMNEYN